MKANRAFGDKAFYGRVFSVMLPIMIQGAFTNFVNMLDNLGVAPENILYDDFGGGAPKKQ